MRSARPFGSRSKARESVMADPNALAQHLLQAALRYIEVEDPRGLSALVREHPDVVCARDAHTGRGAIHAAAGTGSVPLLQILLDAGADPNMPEGTAITDDGKTVYQPGYVPLDYAARGGHAEAVGMLLDRGANPNASDQSDGTPLHAARGASVAIALLKAGASPNATCYLRHFDETLDWHLVATPLHVVAQYGDAETVQALIDHGGRVSEPDGFTGRTPLHYAAARGNLDTTKRLLKLGADPNAVAEMHGYSGVSRMTPLHYAAREGHVQVVRALLEAGANPRLPGNSDEESAAALAARYGHHEIARVLRDRETHNGSES